MDYDIAEHFQEEISLLFDEFLHSMSESGAKVVVTSIKHTSYCTVTVKLWRCRYCLDFETFHNILHNNTMVRCALFVSVPGPLKKVMEIL